MKMRIGKYYIAYGSNLNLKQMKQRCPTAELKGKAVINDYRLRFYGSPLNSVATIEPHKGANVPVLIWLVFTEDEERLDIYEGCPRLYRKELMEVNFFGQPVKAMIYLMNTDLCSPGLPSKIYYRAILQGYKDAGFDPNILREAALSIWEQEDPADDDSWDDEDTDTEDDENDADKNYDSEEDCSYDR